MRGLSAMLVAAMVGALCGAGVFVALVPVRQIACVSPTTTGLFCLSAMYLMTPFLMGVGVVAGWGLLRLTGAVAGWLTSMVGMVFALPLLYAGTVLLGHAKIAVSTGGLLGLVTSSAAVGFALASLLPDAHGGRRDGAEHPGKDGTAA
ncbi:hypothetical protein ACSHWB_17215 [Lentzea sp. HUAS TT2]|uniref:hypothetical protein n=1 Tax=Lentzea sp. HUAS TT2 TaxID=3447454 RepID=UPI003F729E2A